MKLITLSGLDGSGKSTQIQMLKEYLESRGKRVFYFHAVKFGLANKISGKDKTSKSAVKANGWQIFLRKFFLRIDIWRFKSLRSKLCNENYDYILSDRYFYDAAVNIEYLQDAKASDASSLRHRMPLSLPDIAIYLQTLPEIIMQRKRAPDQGLEYLKKKKELYDSVAIIWNMKIIDGNGNKEEIFEEIKTLCQI